MRVSLSIVPWRMWVYGEQDLAEQRVSQVPRGLRHAETPPLSIASLCVVWLLLALCVTTDLRSRRIPNIITFAGIVAGLVLGTAMHGLAGFAASATGLLLAICLLFLPFALGGIGGGDVKMMAAVGALVGPQALLASLLAGMILGGVVAVGVLWRRGRLVEKLYVVGAMLRSALLLRSLDPLRAPAAGTDTIALPYSIPLGVGTALALSWKYTLGA
jgi:prepilin peptidase CpaA